MELVLSKILILTISLLTPLLLSAYKTSGCESEYDKPFQSDTLAFDNTKDGFYTVYLESVNDSLMLIVTIKDKANSFISFDKKNLELVLKKDSYTPYFVTLYNRSETPYEFRALFKEGSYKTLGIEENEFIQVFASCDISQINFKTYSGTNTFISGLGMGKKGSDKIKNNLSCHIKRVNNAQSQMPLTLTWEKVKDGKKTNLVARIKEIEINKFNKLNFHFLKLKGKSELYIESESELTTKNGQLTLLSGDGKVNFPKVKSMITFSSFHANKKKFKAEDLKTLEKVMDFELYYKSDYQKEIKLNLSVVEKRYFLAYLRECLNT